MTTPPTGQTPMPAWRPVNPAQPQAAPTPAPQPPVAQQPVAVEQPPMTLTPPVMQQPQVPQPPPIVPLPPVAPPPVNGQQPPIVAQPAAYAAAPPAPPAPPLPLPPAPMFAGSGLPPTAVQPVGVRPPTPPAPAVQFPGAPVPPPGPDRIAMGATRVLPSNGGPPPGAGAPFPGTPFTGIPAATGLVPPPGPDPAGAGKGKVTGKTRKGDDGARPFFRRPLGLAALATIVLVGLGSLVYYLFFRPAPIYLDPVIVTIPLPTPATSPATIDVGGDFAAALPNQTLTYGLTTIEEAPASARLSWQGRTVERWFLTYEDGTGGEMNVIALEYYHEEDAVAAFEAAVASEEAIANTPAVEASPSPDPSPSVSASAAPTITLTRTPVFAGTSQVGESIKVLTTVTEGVAEDGTGGITRDVAKIIWRNSTGIFIMVADPDVIDDLFLEYEV